MSLRWFIEGILFGRLEHTRDLGRVCVCRMFNSILSWFLCSISKCFQDFLWDQSVGPVYLFRMFLVVEKESFYMPASPLAWFCQVSWIQHNSQENSSGFQYVGWIFSSLLGGTLWSMSLNGYADFERSSKQKAMWITFCLWVQREPPLVQITLT